MTIIQTCTRFCEKMCCDYPVCARLGALYYAPIVDKEADLAKVCEGDRVLCIGGGRTPFTACLFAEKTGAAVTVIDNDPEVIEPAERFVKGWSLQKGDIDIVFEDGRFVNPSYYDLVHLALQVIPQAKIIEDLTELMARNGRGKLLYRTPRQFAEQQYPSCLLSAKGEECSDKAAHTGATMIGETVLFDASESSGAAFKAKKREVQAG
ncbi:hypothetical protein [Salipaludibacillus aurantiacus]|uniref:Nicotianamine synthase protein n=1 Tax=Salipaludibacillus aurantiacus TaxID=1601833 RepID=A0A1H9SAX9_9BACI|nr:hypothetical protein [Salipaludibacillus aurantiacus]SER82078.1 hypothetical protein SAMN05518684_104123 [Salipaludibacillus aurantiacus]